MEYQPYCLTNYQPFDIFSSVRFIYFVTVPDTGLNFDPCLTSENLFELRHTRGVGGEDQEDKKAKEDKNWGDQKGKKHT